VLDINMTEKNNGLPINILLVDDDPDIHMIVKRILSNNTSSSQFKLKSAERISAATKILSDTDIDIILLDLHLPDSDGVETVEKLHSLNPKIPIVVLTILDDERIGAESIKSGAEDYLVKGESLHDVLIRTIRHAIDRRIIKSKLIDMHNELMKSNNENKALLRSITSIIISINKNDQITQWNTVAERVFGITKADVFERSLYKCGIQLDWSRVSEGINLCRVERKPISVDDIPFVRPNGTDGFLGLTINPIIREEVDNPDILLLGADITERKILQTQLSEARKSLVTVHFPDGTSDKAYLC